MPINGNFCGIAKHYLNNLILNFNVLFIIVLGDQNIVGTILVLSKGNCFNCKHKEKVMNNILYFTSVSVAKRMAMYILIALLFFVGASKAQNNRLMHVDKAQRNYLKALNHENEALQESAIFNVMALQQYYPGHNYMDIVDKLYELNTVSDKPEIRYKAFLAYNFFKNSDWFDDYTFVRQPDPDKVFLAIAETVNNHLLKISEN